MNSLAPPVPTVVTRPITLAVLALGGQGGGVLADWIVALAESQDWHAQSTSVPGVAQRTGATIYYIEMLPPKQGRAPVLSLMPAQGDVDIVIAAELMEAGRSMLRGLVTPDRTTLIASSHRAYAIVEKQNPHSGFGDGAAVFDAAQIAAKRTIAFDMEALARNAGSVVSACLFGALCAAEVLPFRREAFEAIIRDAGKGVDASLSAFAAARERAAQGVAPVPDPPSSKRFKALPDSVDHAALNVLIERIRTFTPALHEILYAGVRHLVDFQDPDYAHNYLDRVEKFYSIDTAIAGSNSSFALTSAAAKYIAVAMAYDDVIRVAELKTRSTRFSRVRQEVEVASDQILYTTEYMHPRVSEVTGTMPLQLGVFFEAHPHLLAPFFRSGKRVRSGTIFWFLVLYGVSALKPWRRQTLRHSREVTHLEQWLSLAETYASKNYDLAVEIVNTRRLIKGYSDTFSRGQSKYDRLIAAVPMLCDRPDGGLWMRRLRQAALADEKGDALDGALKTIVTL
jgi:indolepyruvate ferredoxin oxidoreductase, beta subunit